MENENISPEERLFKAIKEGDKGHSSQDIKISAEKKENPPAEESLSEIKPSIEIANLFKKSKNLFDNIFKGKATSEGGLNWLKGRMSIHFETLLVNPRDIDIKNINRLLIGILIILVTSISYFSYHGRRSIKDVVNEVSNINYQISGELVEPFKTVAFYLDEINKRNIFSVYQEVVKEATVDTSNKGIKERLQKIANDLKIIGISWGSDPRVMIKSKEKNKVYFLKEGQNIGATNATVTSIKKNNVTIGLEGEETQLK